jgi:hypothetical protein
MNHDLETAGKVNVRCGNHPATSTVNATRFRGIQDMRSLLLWIIGIPIPIIIILWLITGHA